jgi:hypothetical protein
VIEKRRKKPPLFVRISENLPACVADSCRIILGEAESLRPKTNIVSKEKRIERTEVISRLTAGNNNQHLPVGIFCVTIGYQRQKYIKKISEKFVYLK